MPDEILWQDWLVSEGVVRSGGGDGGDGGDGYFNRDCPPGADVYDIYGSIQPQAAATNTGGASSSGRTLAPIEDVLAGILAATHAMPSWRACEMENSSWEGTAEENIHKYVSSFGVEGDPGAYP